MSRFRDLSKTSTSTLSPKVEAFAIMGLAASFVIAMFAVIVSAIRFYHP
jgi:hypothetical protein